MAQIPKLLADLVVRVNKKAVVQSTRYYNQQFKEIVIQGESLQGLHCEPGAQIQPRVSDTEFRHYSPSYFDSEKGVCEMLIYLHGNGPGTQWAHNLKKGDSVFLLGPANRISFVANLIKNELGLPIASFGGYLKFYCEKHNLPTDRKTLQDTGEAFIKSNPRQFLIDVLSHFIGNADKIILEGVRHKVILDETIQLTEKRLWVYIEADQETRYERYRIRNKDSDELKTYDQFIISDNHPVELEIESLKPLCSFIANSTQDYASELFGFLNLELK